MADLRLLTALLLIKLERMRVHGGFCVSLVGKRAPVVQTQRFLLFPLLISVESRPQLSTMHVFSFRVVKPACQRAARIRLSTHQHSWKLCLKVTTPGSMPRAMSLLFATGAFCDLLKKLRGRFGFSSCGILTMMPRLNDVSRRSGTAFSLRAMGRSRTGEKYPTTA